MKEPKNSRFGKASLFLTAFPAFFLPGFYFTSFGPVIPALRHMYNVTYTERHGTPMPKDQWIVLFPVTMSFLVVGAFVGGILTKYLLLILSRKHLLQATHVFNIFAILVLALVGGLTWSYETIIVGRFMIGVPCGVAYSLIPLMVAEMCAFSQRALWQSIGGVGITFGALCGPSLAHPKGFGNIHRWPILIACAGTPSVIYLMASVWFPETPPYLLRQNKQDEALEALEKLRLGDEDECRREMDNILKETRAEKVLGIRAIVKSKQYRNQLVGACALYANLMLTGINNIAIYSDVVFISAGIAPDVVTFATIGIFALQFCAGLFGSKVVDRFGSYKVNIAANIIAIFSHILFTISQATAHLAPSVMPYLAIVAVAVYMVGWSGGTNLATFALLGEITTEPTRQTIMTYSSIVLWIFSWAVTYVAPLLQLYLGAYNLTIWLGCSIFFLIFMLLFLPETNGKTAEEIQAKFK